MIRVIAIDDEPLALQKIAAYIGKTPFLELVALCHSAQEAREFLQHDMADAVFCDINMPDLNGMDFIKSLTVPPLIVFTTAYAEYAVEGFKVNAVDYLLKPYDLQDFLRAASRLQARLAPKLGDNRGLNMGNSSVSSVPPHSADVSGSTIFLKTDYRIVKVNIHDIRYVEAMSEYLKVFVEGENKPIITLLSMKKLEERLPDDFMRIHRSYIINLKKIQEVNKNRVIMDTETYLPIGDNYKEAFNNYLTTKFLGK